MKSEPPSNLNRRRHAWSSDEEDEALQTQGSDKGGDGEKANDDDE